MYETYWRLKQKPFENAADPRFYYPARIASGGAAEAALRRREPPRRGPVGRPVGRRQDPRHDHAAAACWATISRPSSTSSFRRCPPPICWPIWPTNWTAPLRRRQRPACRRASAGSSASWPPTPSRAGTPSWPSTKPTCSTARQTFEALRLLLNFEPGGGPAMTLLLVGEPSLLPAIESDAAMGRAAGREVPSAALQRAGDGRLRRTSAPRGRRERSIVEPDALPTLQELTHGVARRINRLCDLALLVGYAEEQATLDAGHFESVCRELVAVTPDS